MNAATIIGSGFAGLSTAAHLARSGYRVDVLEKNDDIGGRARAFQAKGFTFDMGPSWYWMPDVFESFFESFNAKTSDFFELIKLDPGFQIIFNNHETMSVPADLDALTEMVESYEVGAGSKLRQFLSEGEFKYRTSMDTLIRQPGLSWRELLNGKVLTHWPKLDLFSSYRKHVASYFKHPHLRALMEFPVMFLGTAPSNTPALYSLMAYSGLAQGTYYPMGGFAKVTQGMQSIAAKEGVQFHTGQAAQRIRLRQGVAAGVESHNQSFVSDVVVGTADYHHVERKLLPKSLRNYPASYWKRKQFSPSCLLFYIGVGKKLNKLIHHNLFFDESVDDHLDAIYREPRWPDKPLFYACCPSKTDPSVAPDGKENLFLLVPIAVGLEDTESIREDYFQRIIKRLESYCGQDISPHIEYRRSYCVNDFEQDYNAYGGNAYGLANTLMQTANLKPKIRNRKIPNLYYAGQLTVPGPGVPPAIISGEIVANAITLSNNPLS